MFYIALIILYSTIPAASLAYTLNLIYQKKNKDGWHLHYLLKYIITLSFLPLLAFEARDIGIIPQSELSVVFLLSTAVIALVGLKPAKHRKVLHFYIGGIYAGFMEEILFRGVIFGLAQVVWGSVWLSLVISSFAFGIWHIKNYWWHQDKKAILIQFLYTAFIYGPIFGLVRIYTGDLYLAILLHYLTDATVALAPDVLRGKIVFGGRRANDLDNY